MTGQFGKNHLGDRTTCLPTAHGFDEFFGNLYHLNAEEEPENPDYPKNPEFKKKFGPRGVIHSFADGKITDTGPLTRKRMETIDEEVTVKALDFMRAREGSTSRSSSGGIPRACTSSPTSRRSRRARPGSASMPTAWSSTTATSGKCWRSSKNSASTDTIVMYSTDNGAETFTWPDGGTTMFRGEKNTQWEGGYRVPAMIRWPGVIKPGTVINDIGAHEDMLTTLVAAAGDKTAKRGPA